jgi:hypothetical protein
MRRGAAHRWLNSIIKVLKRIAVDQAVVCACAVTFLVLSFSTPVLSGEHEPDRFRVHGFGTLAITKSGNEDLNKPYYLSKNSGSDDDAYFDESLFGLQFDTSLSESFEASIQLVLRDRYDDDFEQHIERAFLKYSHNGLLVRAGRLGLDVYMLSEYRNVGYAYPWAHAPLDFYGAFGMDYFDGAEIGVTYQTDRGYVQASLYGGEATQPATMSGTKIQLDYESLFGTTLSYSQDNWMVRVALARSMFASDIESISLLRDTLDYYASYWTDAGAIADDLEIEGTSVTYSSIGGLYDSGDWVVQSELSYADIESDVFPTFYAGYLSIAHRFDSVMPFIVGGFVQPAGNREMRSEAPFGLESLQDALSTIYGVTFDQKSLSFGVRWDVLNNMSLVAQWDRSWLEENGGGLWSFDSINTEAITLDTYSLSCSFIF